MSATVMTVTGAVQPEHLGATLMHEHVFVEYGGPSPEYCTPGRLFDEIVDTCAAYIERIRHQGVQALVDPTTVDLGRNIPLLRALSRKTGFRIICATGIYSTAVYRQVRKRLGGPARVADLFIRELTCDIDATGVTAGIIKVVTGAGQITPDERELLEVAASAATATGAPIITHTEGVLGDEQQRILVNAGVEPRRIIIGHSCLSRNFEYHRRILDGGSYLAFDRFGMPGMPDEVRAETLQALISAGYGTRLVVSHDSVWHWVNGPAMGVGPYRHWKPTNFFERVVPMLRYGGITEEQITALVVDNPRRFFSGCRSRRSGGICSDTPEPAQT